MLILEANKLTGHALLKASNLFPEKTGGWEEGAAAVIKRLGQALARVTCQEENEVIRHLFGKLSILLVKTNSSMILNRVPIHAHPSTNGVL